MSFPVKIGDLNAKKSTKSKLIIDPVLLIVLTIVFCGAVYVLYTALTFDLSQKHLELTKEKQVLDGAQLKLAEKQQKLAEDQWTHEKASEDSKSPTWIYLQFSLNSNKNKFSTFAPLHRPIGDHFEYLLNTYKKTDLSIYYKSAYVDLSWTPTQLGLRSGDFIHVILT